MSLKGGNNGVGPKIRYMSKMSGTQNITYTLAITKSMFVSLRRAFAGDWGGQLVLGKSGTC